jgi:thioredoxin reductase (NADPH)
MSQYLIEQIASKSNIKVLPHAQVISVEGENYLERIEVSVDAPIEMETIQSFEADALFVMIGADACTVMATRRFGARSARLYLHRARPHHLET